ncbi:hypothetical protein [Halococcus sp. IIIV-5B]|uniref:hypothetical protein n=1 Tax=Halococcus sp. IIIV-5B TaxID=2321230 RepID=UPI0011C4A3C4|nr:hypothetical protein [Halococcus sp. IIIV-5B]
MAVSRRQALKYFLTVGVLSAPGCLNSGTTAGGSAENGQKTGNPSQTTNIATMDQREHAKEVLRRIDNKYGEKSGIKYMSLNQADSSGNTSEKWKVVIGVSPNRKDELDQQIPDQISEIPIEVRSAPDYQVMGPATDVTNLTNSNTDAPCDCNSTDS